MPLEMLDNLFTARTALLFLICKTIALLQRLKVASSSSTLKCGSEFTIKNETSCTEATKDNRSNTKREKEHFMRQVQGLRYHSGLMKLKANLKMPTMAKFLKKDLNVFYH